MLRASFVCLSPMLSFQDCLIERENFSVLHVVTLGEYGGIGMGLLCFARLRYRYISNGILGREGDDGYAEEVNSTHPSSSLPSLTAQLRVKS